MDFDCLFNGKDPEETYLTRLMITIFLPAFLITVDLVMIWFLTFMVKLLRRAEERK